MKRVVAALALDVLAVLIFVAIGRRSHDETGSAVSGGLRVAAPFLIGLAVGWLAGRVWKQPTYLAQGVIVWLLTVIVGLVLRNIVFDRGTAVSFIIVTTITLGVLLLGWRAIWNTVAGRRRTP